MEGYYGRIRDIDLAIYRGAYKVNDIYLNKVDSVSNLQTPFFESRVIDFSIDWKSLFNGRLVGEMAFVDPMLMFTKAKVEPDDLQKDTSDFRKLLNDFMPLKVNRFEIDNGEVHFVDSGSTPVVNIKMTNTHVLALNLSNVQDTSSKGLPSSITASADIYGGTLEFNMRLDPLAVQTRFDMDAEIKNTQLTELNDFFKAYAKVDVNKGSFGMYTELATTDGKFVGYVKPIIKDLDVRGPEDKNDSFFQKLWESAVGTAADVLSNWKKDQFATKIPLEGNLSDPKANIWVTIFEMLRNAFVNALQPSLDYDVNIATVENKKVEKKNFIQKIFGGSDKKNEKGGSDNQKLKRSKNK